MLDTIEKFESWIELYGDFVLFIFDFFALLYIIFLVICLWKIYEKAGEPGWTCLIPVYSYYVLMRITCKNHLMWFIFLFIPVLNYASLFVSTFGLAKSFGKGVGMFLLLLFLPYVALPILAFGDSEYDEFFRI